MEPMKKQAIAISIITLGFLSCDKEKQVTPLNTAIPTEVSLKATVPAVIYSNKKEFILDASATKKLNGTRSIQYLWSCTKFPSKKPDILYPESSSTEVINFEVGSYRFNLQVTDNFGNQASNDFDLVVYQDTLKGPPVLPPLTDKTYQLPQPVYLSALNVIEANPAGRTLKTQWIVLAQPNGSSAVDFIGSSPLFREVKGCVPGKYIFMLEIINELHLKAADTVELTILPDPLTGTVKIYDNLVWNKDVDEFGETYIGINITDPNLSFVYRDRTNTEVSLWDFEKQDWIALANFVGHEGGLYLYSFPTLNTLTANSNARVRVKFL